MQKRRALLKRELPPCQTLRFFLFLFKTIATGATFRVAATRIAYVDFAKGAVVAGAVVFTFRNAATDRSVDFVLVFVHHTKKSSFKGNLVFVVHILTLKRGNSK